MRKKLILLFFIIFVFVTGGFYSHADNSAAASAPGGARPAAGTEGAMADEGAGVSKTEEDTVWTKNFEMASDDLSSVAFGRDRFVAVGGDGTVLVSSDGLKWVRGVSGTTSHLADVAWNGERFIAVGTKGAILSSEDGISWSPQSMGESTIFSHVLWDGSRFIVVGTVSMTDEYHINRREFFKGIIACSADGSSWQTNTVEGFDGIYEIAGSPGKYVMIADKHYEKDSLPESSRIFFSSDLSDWKLTRGAENAIVSSAIYDGSRFLAAGADGAVLTSADGEDWSRSNISPGYYISGIIFNDSKYIAVGSAILDSDDGENWTRRVEEKEGGRGHYLRAAWGKNRFVTVGMSGAISYSANGSDWTEVFPAKCSYYTNIYWDGERYIAVGDQCSIAFSSDGETWTSTAYSSFLQLNALAWNGKRYVAVGGQQFMRSSGGIILSSPDLIQWTEYTGLTEAGNENGYGNEVNGVASDGNCFAAVQGSGKILFSPDGADWSVVFDSKNSLSDIIWDGRRFVAAGYSGVVLVSKDGRRWVSHNTGKAFNFRRIARAGNRYVGTGWNQNESGLKACIVVSDDAVRWKTLKTVPNIYLNGIAWDGSGCYITGELGKLLYSRDFKNWSFENTNTDNTLTSAAWDGSRLVVAGSGGTILNRTAPRNMAPPVLEITNETSGGTEPVEMPEAQTPAESTAAGETPAKGFEGGSFILLTIILPVSAVAASLSMIYIKKHKEHGL